MKAVLKLKKKKNWGLCVNLIFFVFVNVFTCLEKKTNKLMKSYTTIRFDK